MRRREFIGAAGAALAAPGEALAAAPVRAPTRTDLERVEHVVVLMQENRSFDHYFGTLPGVRGFSDPNAMPGVFNQPYALSADGHLRPWHFDAATASPCNVLVDNSWTSRHNAFADGAMNGFTAATANLPNHFVMSYYERADIPWHCGLADAFTVCDAYHCSVLGPTNPNRLYLWTATIDPNGRDGGPDNDNQAYSNSSTSYTWKTYPERLQAAGISWRVYHSADDFDDNALKYFKAYQQAQPGSPLYENAMRNRPDDAFIKDVENDALPQVSWIVGPTATSEHPGYNPGRGADYANTLLQAFARRPDVWAKTVFIWTYDEDGGYFDHVRPPTPPAGTADEFVAGKPIGLGFRVPCVVCSPWTRGGNVCSVTYDHTSIIRFLERRFGVHEPQISAWRRQTCGDLWECFDFAHPDYGFPQLPPTAAAAAQADDRCANNPIAAPRPVNGAMPKQEPGTKPRRPCGGTRRVAVKVPRGATSMTVDGRRRALPRRRRVVIQVPAGSTVVVTFRVRGKRVRRTLRGRC